MGKLVWGMIFASTVLSQESFGMQGPMLSDIIAQPDPLQSLQGLKATNPDHQWSLCQEIMDPGFYKVAEAKGLGILKRNKLIGFCEALKLERQKVEPGSLKDTSKPPVVEEPVRTPKQVRVPKPSAHVVMAEPKHVEKKMGPVHEEKKAVVDVPLPEKPVLKLVDLSIAAKTVEEEEIKLKAAQEALRENAQRLGKIEEFKVKLQKVTEELLVAEEHYNNLNIAVIGMKEDLKEPAVARNLKVFKPHDHEHDSPEQFVTAAKAQLAQEKIEQSQDTKFRNTFPQFMVQLHLAAALLEQAQKNLAKARLDLVAINEEMMQFTH
jgi:hypothetical protein